MATERINLAELGTGGGATGEFIIYFFYDEGRIDRLGGTG